MENTDLSKGSETDEFTLSITRLGNLERRLISEGKRNLRSLATHTMYKHSKQADNLDRRHTKTVAEHDRHELLLY